MRLKVKLLGLITWANVGLGIVARAINTWSVLPLPLLPPAAPAPHAHRLQVHESHLRHASYCGDRSPLCCRRCWRCNQPNAAAAAAARLHRACTRMPAARAALSRRPPYLVRLQVCLASIVVVGVASSLVPPLTVSNNSLFSRGHLALPTHTPSAPPPPPKLTFDASALRCRGKAFFSVTCACSPLRCAVLAAQLLLCPTLAAGCGRVVQRHGHERRVWRCALLCSYPGRPQQQHHILHTGLTAPSPA
jgi:hypothetical protein